MNHQARYIVSVAIFIALLTMGQTDALGQFRADQPSPFDRTGPVVKQNQQEDERILGLFDFNMSHSYEVSVGSFGGQTYNQNFYTNTMHFTVNEDLSARVDLSVGHSPFGNGLMGDQSTRFFVRNAELNYNLNDKTHFRVSFQQMPAGYGYGYNPYRMRGYNMYNPYAPRW